MKYHFCDMLCGIFTRNNVMFPFYIRLFELTPFITQNFICRMVHLRKSGGFIILLCSYRYRWQCITNFSIKGVA